MVSRSALISKLKGSGVTCVTTVNVARNALLYNAACRHGDWAQAAYLFAHTPGSVCDVDTDY
jgi:hypothetical protein